MQQKSINSNELLLITNWHNKPASNSLDLVRKLLDTGLRINLKDKFDFLEHIFKLNESQVCKSECFSYYLECFILLLKNFCFFDVDSHHHRSVEPGLDVNDFCIDIKYNKSAKSKINCNKFLTMVFVNFFYKILSNYARSSSLGDAFKQRFVYMFALAVYSGQLSVREPYFKQWLDKLDSKHHNLRFVEIYTESTKSPWSLQMICRVQVKKSFAGHNLDRVLAQSAVGLKLPSICIRYLKFDFI